MEFTAEQIAAFLGGEVQGDKAAKVWTIAKIEDAQAGALCFLSNMKYEHFLYTTGASIVLVASDLMPSQPVAATLVRVADPYGALAKLLELYVAGKPRKTGISPLASIDPTAEVAEDCYVGEYAVVCPGAKIGAGGRVYPGVYVGDNVTIGRNVLLNPGVVIYSECVLGDNVTIHSGTVVGADGFGFAPNKEGGYDKIPQIGNVIIESDVEIGSNTCIDRATLGSTVIRRGAKIDNLVQIAHNVVMGESTVMAAQGGVAGSTKIGSNCMFGGQVGIVGHIEVGDRVQVASQSGISNSVPAGQTLMGSPAMPAMQHHRANAIYRRLPELEKRISELEKKLAEK